MISPTQNTLPTMIIKQIPLSNLIVDARYQRSLISKHVNRIAKNFDATLVNTILVSDRQDGTYAVIDGQHRVAAMRKLGIKFAPCTITHGLDSLKEASLFHGVNAQIRPLSTFDKFKTSVFCGNSREIAIAEIAKEYGIQLKGSHSNGGNTSVVIAIQAVCDIYDVYGADILRKTFMLIQKAWKEDKEGRGQLTLMGVSRFLAVYGDRIDIEDFAIKLQKTSPLEIRRLSVPFQSSAFSTRGGIPVARALVRKYNYNRKSKTIDDMELVNTSRSYQV